MHNIANKLTEVRERVQASSRNSVKGDKQVSILAVSKRQPSSAIQQAYNAGQRDFGENYLQEATQKINELKDLQDIQWHFIGPIQSNKTKGIAENFTWAHTVDRLKIAQRLSEQRPNHLSPLNICLQINIDNEPTKSGIDEHEVLALAQAIQPLKGVRLRGLMAIPEKSNATDAFQRMQALKNALADHTKLNDIDTLSMGMSHDLEEAIKYGATIVRVGTAIFGPREPQLRTD